MSYEIESLKRFKKGKKLTGIGRLDKIIGDFRLGQWFDHEGYEDQGFALMDGAVKDATTLPDPDDRKKIADILWPET